MRAVSWLDMVALEVEGDVGKGLWVAINVEGADGAREVLAGLCRLLDLAVEVLGEVGGSWRIRSAHVRQVNIYGGIAGGRGTRPVLLADVEDRLHVGREGRGRGRTIRRNGGAGQLEQLGSYLDGEDALVREEIRDLGDGLLVAGRGRASRGALLRLRFAVGGVGDRHVGGEGRRWRRRRLTSEVRLRLRLRQRRTLDRGLLLLLLLLLLLTSSRRRRRGRLELGPLLLLLLLLGRLRRRMRLRLRLRQEIVRLEGPWIAAKDENSFRGVF